jgi:hypothetical protein
MIILTGRIDKYSDETFGRNSICTDLFVIFNYIVSVQLLKD